MIDRTQATVLVVDDKEMMRDSVGSTLTRAGMRVVCVDSGDAAIERIAQQRPDAILTDLRMPGMTGMELLERVREIDSDLPIVLMTAFGAVDTAVQAIKLGAFDYITKPFEGDQVVITMKRAIDRVRLMRENAVLRARTPEPGEVEEGPRGLDRIIGKSPAIRRVKQQIVAVAESQGTVLVVGESGAGKEVIARAIHELSPREASPFLAVNCAALSESLLESELFGHERGAFTGADKMRKGRFELADGGTLLLDEVSEIGTPLQAKLLRVLQERAFERVGSSLTIGVDVRVVATSNRELPREVSEGRFRQDLFFRLNVLPVHLPPLRDRLEDVPELAEFFVSMIARREGRETPEIEPEAQRLLMSYAWPGNVRELQNICERAVVLSRGMGEHSISVGLVRPWLGQVGAEWDSAASAPSVSFPGASARQFDALLEAAGHGSVMSDAEPSDADAAGATELARDGMKLADIERKIIVETLHRFNGHRQKTAQSLGIGVRTLGLKLKKWKELNLVEATL